MRSWCLAALVALCGVPVLSAASGPAHLVADLKPGFAPLDETGATFDSYTAVNGRVIFLATLEGDVQPQCSLWTTDGTAAGTSWLAGLCDDVEPNDYTPQAGIWVTTGSMAFFTDYFGRFWRTDGTAEGTFRLGGGALKRGFSGVHRPLLGPDGRTIFFEGCTEAYGCEPWRSDGTPEGTVLLGDLQRGQESSDPEGFILDGRRVLFATYGGVWATDGSPRGTVQVFQTSERADWLHVRGPEIFFGIGISVWAFDKRDRKVHVILSKYSLGDHIGVSLAEAGGRLLLVPFDREATPGISLWETGGTRASTHRVGPRFTGGLEEFAGVGSRVVFAATTGEGFDLDLFFLDPGMRVAERFTRCPGGCPTVVSGVSGFAPFKGRLLFAGRDPLHGTELWSTDGTPQGTRLLKDLCPGACDGIPVSLRVLGDRLLFRDARQQLWVTDGTEAGTTLLALLTSLPTHEPWRFSVDAAALDGRIVFTGFDPQGGLQPWVSDLTPEGTAPLAQIGSNLAAGLTNLVPTAVGARVVLVLYDGSVTRLWGSDGTAAGTALLLGDTTLTGPCFSCPGMTPVGGRLFFNSGARLWRTDGTPGGTQSILDLGPAGELVGPMGALGNRLIFTAAQSPVPPTIEPWELWTSDGTAAGTQKFLSLTEGNTPDAFMDLGGQALFFVTGLWRTDGTAAGTLPIRGGIAAWPFEPAALFRGKLFFQAQDYQGPIDLWQSDGTAAGTSLLGQGTGFSRPTSPSGPVAFRDALYFTDWNSQVLWRSDGTAAGTRPFELPLNSNGDPLRVARPPVPLGDQLFFAANDGVHGWELWKTDGTATGTVLVRDIAPGPAFSRPESLTVAGGRLYFTATDGEHGLELWTSDGTATGTRMVQDILPGPASSWPQNLAAADGNLFFTATDGEHGRELWVLPLEP